MADKPVVEPSEMALVSVGRARTAIGLSVWDMGIEVMSESTVEPYSHITGMDYTDSFSVFGELIVCGQMNGPQEPRVLIFTPDGSLKMDFKSTIKNPWQLKIDLGNFYLSDTDEICIKKINKEGSVTSYIEPAIINDDGVIGVALSEGKVFMTLEADDCVFACGKNGDVAEPWSTRSIKLKSPWHLTYAPNGDVIVTDHRAHRIVTFDKRGEHVFTYGSQGRGDGQLSYPYATCCDKDGRIYIADFDNDRVSVLTPEGDFIRHLLTKKDGLKAPRALSISPDGKLLAIAHENNKLIIFKPSQ